jgi:predicted PurR-regulated permease PerM
MTFHIKPALYIRVALILHAVILSLFLLHVSKTITIPLFFAFLIAILLYPVSNWLEKHRLSRGLAAAIAVTLFVLLVGAFVYFFSMQLVSFSKNLPQLENRFGQVLQHTQDWIHHRYHIDNSAQMNYINKSADSIAGTLASSIGTTFIGLGELLILIVFFFIFTFFILFHRAMLLRFLLSFFSEQQRCQVNDAVFTIRKVMNGYVLGLLTEMALLILLIFTPLYLLGVRYALLMAAFAGVLNLIPYLGIYTALAIGMLITLANGTGSQALELAIVFIVAHTLDANILLPRIVGGRVKMNAFITLLAMLAGRLVWGIPGMFLFIPLAAIIRIISERVKGLEPWAILMGEEKRQAWKQVPAPRSDA